MDEHRLGTLLLENPLMREEDLERCLQIQRLGRQRKPLGQILIEEGLLTQAALDRLLEVQARLRQTMAPRPPIEGSDCSGLLRAAVAAGASELIFSEGRPAVARIGGHLTPLTREAFDGEQIRALLRDRVGEGSAVRLEQEGSLCHDFEVPGLCRGRIAAFSHFGGIAAVIRLHPCSTRTLPQAGLDPALEAVLHQGKGLVLVAGGVRTGITETIGAMLQVVARNPDHHIVVLDQSLEYERDLGPALVVRRRVGEHTPDYRTALLSAIRRDPDVIVVGDATQPDVFDLCVRAAEAGRLVVAGITGATVVGALERALAGYVPAEAARARVTVAAILTGVVAVHLVPEVNRDGMVLATEVLLVDEAVREIIRTGALAQLNLLLRLEGAECGHSLDSRLLALLAASRIRFEDAFRLAEDKSHVLAISRKEG